MTAQPGILAPVPSLSRYLFFSLTDSGKARQLLSELPDWVDGERAVLGLGQSLLEALEITVPGMAVHPCHSRPGVEVPSTPCSLWFWLRGDDRGEHIHQTRELQMLLAEGFALQNAIDGFRYGIGRDLTGYKDGTENPEGDDALNAALLHSDDPRLHHSSFVAVQQWQHNLTRFQSFSRRQQDFTIGRRLDDNEELDDAPASAHVKRTAQESFDPEAFVVRRSMPWSDACREGLVFVAFGKSFQAYQQLLNRMVGLDDGITDALFQFSRPLTGSFFWCPPVRDGRLI